ncbi:cytochrome c-type biogenesis protein CcsB [Oceanihabitans sediminis]|uniref:Cytochrome C biogenesis protein n=1 Tax=Oceanihabitans sediminis TaxID=1812012 RepID=A0A368P5I6_9FLAO|nr:cytochrome c biogenesis protein CcsA [Oceanihabitans sediminis]RBP32745.1 cytochrome c-type biogenesis protein CcsB [Oceanihabitans sediminis]RCU57716.1 cytochrome C biogenesis protein [Oceanihabitans sediminis]
MQKKISNILFSTRLTAILFVVFAVAMGVGTFLDAGMDTSPTPYSRNLIYNTWWFEAVMVFFVINFVGNIFRYRLHKKEKWATLVLHLSFILILVGAFVTRYISYEGVMAIREGETENKFLSQKTYLIAYIDGDYEIDGVPQRLPIEKEVDFSPRMKNNFEVHTDYNNQPVSIVLEDYIGGAEEDIIPDESGEEYLKIVESGGAGPHNHFLKSGEVQSLHNVLFALNKPTKGAVNITKDGDNLTIESPFEGEYMTMATGATGKLEKDSIQPLILRSRYIIGGMQMVFPKPVTKGVFGIVKKSELLQGDENGLILNVTANGETKKVGLLGGQYKNNAFKQVKIGGLDFAFRYGAQILELPFDIKLNDFIAERYPGTEKSYSSYASEVTVFDKEKGDFDYRIYMNNILDHGGYKFFQSNFDPDEKGTILSVNHDFWGTWITYIGYILLYIGMIAILIAKGTRFGDLRRQLNKIKTKKAKLLSLVFFCFALQTFSQEQHEGDHQAPTPEQIDSILVANKTPKAHADKFGRLVIQDLSGRMMPMNTYASELVRKIHHDETYAGLSPNQILLSISESPLLWYNVPIIYMKPMQTDSLKSILGIPKEQKYATIVDFFDDNLNYKLNPYLEDAYKAQSPNGYQKEIKLADQRASILSNAIEGLTLKIFPVPDDENNKWISPLEYRKENYREKISDSLYGNFINSGFSAYLFTLNQAKQTGDYTEAEKLLESFSKTQHKYGSAVMLSDNKIDAEISYNKYNIFKKLYRYYLLAGVLMFVFLIIQILNSNKKWINVSVNISKCFIVALFAIHTLGLIVRWYISGHAPWSDTYETMLYVAWSAVLFGLIFIKKSDLTVASTAFVASIILFFAHQNWLDPAIANLQPVLNSYWLMIHVSVIVASYGPFVLGLILGVVSLFLMISTTEKNKKKMLINIRELTIINEMALTVGLVMLTIGNFLGGMWANESWGRYWGWDPKETWALISIMVYAFVIHMRLVPGLRGLFAYNLASIIAFASIMMTYFGVNFYLAGLHSYASGDQVMSVKIIGICCAVVAMLGGFAYRKYLKFYKK